MGEFGDKFRKAREKKEISLDDVSNVTKISSRMLRAIEEEHFDELPGGVFNKGFIRAYAKHLGLDAEEAVTDYLACLRQAQIDAHEVWEPEPATRAATAARVPPQQKSVLVEHAKPVVKSQAPVLEELPGLQLPRAEHVRPAQKDFGGASTPDIPWRIIAVATVVIVLAAILWIRHSHRAHSAAAVPPAQQTIPAPVASAPQPAPAGTAIAKAPSKPAPTTTAPSSTPKFQQPQITHSAAAVSTPSSPVVTESNDVTTRTFGKPSTAPAKSTASLSLVIRAQETSWISVQADGQQVSQETLIAPAHASIRAGREIVARVGNAAGVTFVFNGQEIPANGAEAEVKTFVFDTNGMRVIPTAPLPTQDH